ncbi:hypothetical protein KDA_25120 [Dictyobacter alpinus]|uniref:FtsK domain-containing protein n=1 Tax=Dictyobacter alpinus TaxID=2014873 RepID=A0A402B6Q3_9CHLR|nr:FtsK/SpoIIIE domain-containing protein [Dictyobacter alpinus]GCE27028.1 hypothetical protein KDA_25120 [Dictyobacter alpinus]
MSYQQPSSIITRKARVWPEISEETILLPTTPVLLNSQSSSILTFIFLSLVGLAIYGYMFTHFNATGEVRMFLLPCLATGGLIALALFSISLVKTIRILLRNRLLLQQYLQQLQEVENQLKACHWQERQAYMNLDPPLSRYDFKSAIYEHLEIIPLLQNTYNEQNSSLWARQPADRDFMKVRIGLQERPATYKIWTPQEQGQIITSRRLQVYKDYAQALLEKYSTVHVPLQIDLQNQSPITIYGPGTKLFIARELLHAILSQLVYHHSPEDVRIIILAPRSQERTWQWAEILPHTVRYDARHSSAQMEEAFQAHTCAIGTTAIMDQLPLISRELRRREVLINDMQPLQKTALHPHLLIVIDDFETAGDLDQSVAALPNMVIPPSHPTQYRRSHLSVSPLRRPELALALNHGAQLGVSVLCVCTKQSHFPQNSQLLIDLQQEDPPKLLLNKTSLLPQHKIKTKRQKKAESTETMPQVNIQARIRQLTQPQRPTQQCMQLDGIGLDDLRSLALRLQSLQSSTNQQLELRTQVDIRSILDTPIEIQTYDPFVLWSDPLFRTPQPLLRIPIGLTFGDEVQYLDLLRDGPHGLLIGQTGSGKSELLQTMLLSLAFLYKPTEVNFLLLDHKVGLALKPFGQLPHTLGLLTQMSSAAGWQRFTAMLRAEISKRKTFLNEGRSIPHLVIIIDGFTEIVRYAEAVLDELLMIMGMEPELGLHLLLAAQRPEGIIYNNIRDAVQYRICLRCATPQESREVLRRTDAADLPASIPGRAYLLHGDNQLDLFQAARVTTPIYEDRIAAGQSRLNSLLSLPFKGK